MRKIRTAFARNSFINNFIWKIKIKYKIVCVCKATDLLQVLLNLEFTISYFDRIFFGGIFMSAPARAMHANLLKMSRV